MGAAVPDEAGQEPDDGGQTHTDQQRVLEGVQHWEERSKGEAVSAAGEAPGDLCLPP